MGAGLLVKGESEQQSTYDCSYTLMASQVQYKS